MTEIVARRIDVSAGSAALLTDVSVSFREGELVAILGPNGAGKTSLVKAMLGMIPRAAGVVQLDGVDCAAISGIDRARQVSYLPQVRPLAWPISVFDVVSLGRFAHGAALGRLGSEDHAAVKRAIAACDLEDLAERHTDSLSGGEIARVHFARAIAANTPLLIADEPVAALDPRHQLRIAALLRRYVDDGGGALVVLHEVSLAARIADRLVWLKDGRVVADGPPAETLTAETMATTYGVCADITTIGDRLDVRVHGELNPGDTTD